MNSPHYISKDSNFDFRYVRLFDLDIPTYRKMVVLFANRGDSDQTPRFAASDLGLHYLPFTLLGVSRLRLVNATLSRGFLFLHEVILTSGYKSM